MTINYELTSTAAYKPSTNQLVALTSTPRDPSALETAPSATRQDTATLTSSSIRSTHPTIQDDSRTAHIAALTQSIAAGTYSVPALAVAGSIIDVLF